jgi:hypothetical protein
MRRLGLVTRIVLNHRVPDGLEYFGGKLTVLRAVGVDVGVVLFDVKCRAFIAPD